MRLAPFLLFTSSLLFFSLGAFAQNEPSFTVIEADSSLEGIYTQMISNFENKGPDVVAKEVLKSLKDPKDEQAWQQILGSTEIKVREVKIHPNRKSADTEMNMRFQRMGIPQLKFEAKEDSTLQDPNELDPNKIKKMKWIRYLAGPGVAVAATYLGLPAATDVGNLSNYGLLILPSVGVGVTTILLEFQFAHPWLNNHFWKKVWEFGGPVTGRLTNIFVNFLYGMSLYGAGVGASHLPVFFGGSIIPFEHLPFPAAALSAFIGGVIFHITMGQYQTDISQQQTRGNMSAEERYAKEGVGVVTNNGARILNWVMPSWDWFGYLAQWGFFGLKTVPQLWKTHLSPRWIDKKINQQVAGLHSKDLENKTEGINLSCKDQLKD